MKKLSFIFIMLFTALVFGQQQVHKKRSALTSDGDSTRVQIKDWNAPHFENPATSAFFWDDFMGGLNTSGNIGRGWSETSPSSSPSMIAGPANHPGVCSLFCGAAASNYIAIRLSSSTTIAPFVTPVDFEAVFIIRPDEDTNVANGYHLRIGLVDAMEIDSVRPSEGIYFEKLVADNFWHGVTRNAGTENRTADMTAANNVWTRLKIRYNDDAVDSVGFTINDNAEVMAVVTNIPNADPLMPYMAVDNSNTAFAFQAHIDYFHWIIWGLTR